MELEELATEYYKTDAAKNSPYYNKPRKFVADEQILRKTVNSAGIEEGCDIYLSTSSAGGGLQMMVFGVVKGMTAESAQRAALEARPMTSNPQIGETFPDHEDPISTCQFLSFVIR